MAKAKIKALLPSLREKKRYIAYEVFSKSRFNDTAEINKSILNASKDFLGSPGMAKAGILPLSDQWNSSRQRGIIRVNHKHINELKASFVFVKSIGSENVVVRSVGASGVLKKAQQKYLYKAQ